MKECIALGIDLAKLVFFVVGMDARGAVVLRKRLRRDELESWVSSQAPLLIGMESGSGSHYWARVFERAGHEVRLIPPQFVRPFVKSNKNDNRDAEAICEAVMRPTMRFVNAKTQTEQELQMYHRSRERTIKNRTALVNELRGFLHELGIVMPQGIQHFRAELPRILEKEQKKLSELSRELFSQLYSEFLKCDAEAAFYDKVLLKIAKAHPQCQNLQTIPGVGPITATAILAMIGEPHRFKNGRCFAACLGLVPRQHSSGGKETLLGISKRGNPYLRKLLVHGARSLLRVVRKAKPESSAQARWVHGLVNRRGVHRTMVALANKNARIIWSVLARNEVYDSLRGHAVGV